MSGILGAIIGTGLNFVSDWYQYERNREENREIGDLNFQRQRWMQAQDYYNNLEMWRLQNEYNTPAAQMQRFIEAGLNPNLIYGQSNMAGSVSPGTFSAPQTKEAQYQSTMMENNMLLDSLFKLQQIKNLEANNEQTILNNQFLRDSYKARIYSKMIANNLADQKYLFNKSINPWILSTQQAKSDYYGGLNWLTRSRALDQDFWNQAVNPAGDDYTQSLYWLQRQNYQHQTDLLSNELTRDMYMMKYYKYDQWVNRIGNTLENSIGKLPFGFKVNKFSLAPGGAKRVQYGFGR